jgi:hypothetical protein
VANPKDFKEMLVILLLSKRGEIKISMILPYNPRDIIKVIISTIATNIAFIIISFIYLFLDLRKHVIYIFLS